MNQVLDCNGDSRGEAKVSDLNGPEVHDERQKSDGVCL